MAAYMIIIGDNRNQEWMADYIANVPAIFRRYGGEYVDVAQRVEQFEGVPLDPNLAAIFSFPSLEKIKAFLADEEYKPYADARKAGMGNAILFGFDTDAA